LIVSGDIDRDIVCLKKSEEILGNIKNRGKIPEYNIKEQREMGRVEILSKG